MRQDDRGFTLVELIIAIAISSIVLGAAVIFLNSAQRSYRTAESTINLQVESQILMEQLANWVMESNRIEVAGNVLTLYDIPRNNGRTETELGDTSASKRVIWVKDGKMYMVKVDGIADADHDTAAVNRDAKSVQENCIGQYVFKFSMLYDPDDSPEKITVTLHLRDGQQEYEMKNEFTMRNEYLPKSASTKGMTPFVTAWKGECHNV